MKIEAVLNQFGPELLDLKDFRAFGLTLREKAEMSYAEIARGGGFSSRAHVREILTGDRPITEGSARKLTQGLRLAGNWKRYFRLLIAQSENELRPESWSPEKLQAHLEKLKQTLNRSKSRRDINADAKLTDRFLAVPHFLEIFAATGELGVGATLDQIAYRTQLEPLRVSQSLKQLEELGVVQFDKNSGHFVPQDYHLAISDAERSGHFHMAYVRGLERARESAIKEFSSQEKLFIQSVFCVNEKELPELKLRLRSVLTEFADRSINDTGERIITVISALF